MYYFETQDLRNDTMVLSLGLFDFASSISQTAGAEVFNLKPATGNQTKSNHTKLDQTKTDEIKANQTKTINKHKTQENSFFLAKTKQNNMA